MSESAIGPGDARGWAARLGSVSLWGGDAARLGVPEGRAFAREVEELGFRSWWIGEGAKDIFGFGALVLGDTKSLVFASSIASIYSRDATAMVNGQRTIAGAFPGRFILGLGVSHRPAVTRRGGDYGPPVPTMKAYLEAMDAARPAGSTEELPRMLAALGPQMLRLSARMSLGANPYFVPVAHTAFARKTLGPSALLAVEQAVVLAPDAASGRAAGRRHAKFYLAAENYRNNLIRLGWPESDLTEEGSDKVIDALVAYGDAAAIRRRIDEHLAAGADTVSLQVLPADPAGTTIADVRKLAPALLR